VRVEEKGILTIRHATSRRRGPRCPRET
jgi:hypothetical protein